MGTANKSLEFVERYLTAHMYNGNLEYVDKNFSLKLGNLSEGCYRAIFRREKLFYPDLAKVEEIQSLRREINVKCSSNYSAI